MVGIFLAILTLMDYNLDHSGRASLDLYIFPQAHLRMYPLGLPLE